MAPAARNGKRTATVSVEEPPHKKAAPLLKKHGVTQASFKQMAEVLQHPLAGHLPEDCKKMLVAMLPQSLCVPSDAREEVQHLAVKIFGEVVASVEANLKEALETEMTKVKVITDSKEQLLEAVSKAQEQLKEAQQHLEVKDDELKTSSQAVVAAKSTLTKKEEEQKTGDATLLQTEGQKAELEHALEAFTLLKAGECESSDVHLKALETTMGKVTMEESLKTAIIPVLLKVPAERGGFDETVLVEFQNIFQAKLKELAEVLQAGAPERQARQLCVDEARAQLDEAESKQKEQSGELLASKQKQKEAMAAMKEAEGAVASYEVNLKAAMEIQEEKQKDLDNFVENTVKGFTDLKERLSAKRLKELAAEAKAAEAAEAAAAEAAAAEAEAAAAAEATKEVPEAEAATTEVAEPQIEAMEA